MIESFQRVKKMLCALNLDFDKTKYNTRETIYSLFFFSLSHVHSFTIKRVLRLKLPLLYSLESNLATAQPANIPMDKYKNVSGACETNSKSSASDLRFDCKSLNLFFKSSQLS